MNEQSRIRVHGHGEVEVDLIVDYLTDLKRAYNSILVFESWVDGLSRNLREHPFYILRPSFQFLRGAVRPSGEWPPSAEEIASFVPHSQQLVLSGVRLQSPGFWEFIGNLNSLEVIRKYLNDRHERRKDRNYRESAEARRLLLENMKTENEVIATRIELAKKLGATERDLAPYLNLLVFRPLRALDRHQDRGVIQHVEKPPPSEPEGGSSKQ